MAGTAIIGRGAEGQLSTDGGTVYNKVGGVLEMTPDFSIEEVPTTDMDSNGFVEIILGDMMGEVGLSVNYEEDDTQQGNMRTAFWGHLQRHWRIRPQVGAGKIQVFGACFVTRWPLTIPASSKQAQSAKVKYTGTITMNTQ